MYVALYRKYRPRDFESVVGQEHITRTLINQIATDKISHAYLFCGTRGTGKTSVAKIFAAAVNCIDSNNRPCWNCETCLANLRREYMNVIEIDAASNNGVDNIRDIREEVKYPPVNAKFKVYIIDEVHMLSTGAFNALLKTLEEPPEHVVFILATTEPQKIPATILSRCQRFDFKRIPATGMANAIEEYMATEGVAISREAIDYVVKISDGAMRDALSILDRLIAFYIDEEITLDKVICVIGTVNDEVCNDLLKLICQNNITGLLSLINNIINNGLDINQFIVTFILFLRDLLMRDFKQEYLNYLEIFAALQTEARYSSNPRVLFEIACIKAGAVDKSVMLKTIDEPIQIKEKIVSKDVQHIREHWQEIISHFTGLMHEILRLCKVGDLEHNVVYILVNDLGSQKILEQRKDELLSVMKSLYSEREFDIAFMLRHDYELKHEKIYGTRDDYLSGISEINFPVDFE